ncbi:MAG: hypothetical protein ACREAC_22515 [Blastocatellia bacterium]
MRALSEGSERHPNLLTKLLLAAGGASPALIEMLDQMDRDNEEAACMIREFDPTLSKICTVPRDSETQIDGGPVLRDRNLVYHLDQYSRLEISIRAESGETHHLIWSPAEQDHAPTAQYLVYRYTSPGHDHGPIQDAPLDLETRIESQALSAPDAPGGELEISFDLAEYRSLAINLMASPGRRFAVFNYRRPDVDAGAELLAIPGALALMSARDNTVYSLGAHWRLGFNYFEPAAVGP